MKKLEKEELNKVFGGAELEVLEREIRRRRRFSRIRSRIPVQL